LVQTDAGTAREGGRTALAPQARLPSPATWYAILSRRSHIPRFSLLRSS